MKMSFFSRSVCVLAKPCVVVALLVQTAWAGTFSVNTWTNDASSGIVSGQTVWAYHFGVTNVATVNGVTVPGI